MLLASGASQDGMVHVGREARSSSEEMVGCASVCVAVTSPACNNPTAATNIIETSSATLLVVRGISIDPEFELADDREGVTVMLEFARAGVNRLQQSA
jgi:hypothetical protein